MVVTQEDVDEYGTVKSAVNGRVVEAEKVCNEFIRIRLIEFNAIGFDLIEFNSIPFNRICLWTGYPIATARDEFLIKFKY